MSLFGVAPGVLFHSHCLLKSLADFRLIRPNLLSHQHQGSKEGQASALDPKIGNQADTTEAQIQTAPLADSLT